MTPFMAEIGSNHNGSLARALELVDTAAAIGCAAVKVQFFTAARLFAGERAQAWKSRELPAEWLPHLARRARLGGLEFGCSVFDPDGATQAAAHADILKVASYSILDTTLLATVARLGRRVVVGTGMATMEELWRAMRAMAPCQPTLLHCVSSYPAPPGACNLAAIRRMHDVFQLPVGWSDHTGNMGVVLRAALRHQAAMVECHLDLDGQGAEYAGGHCWLPDALQDVVLLVRDGAEADGDGAKRPQSCELPERAWRADPADGLRPLQERR